LFAIYGFGKNLVDLAKGAGEQLQAVEWVLIGVPAVIILWLLRFLHRQATANLAGMDDANERVTMVETYLALQNEGKIEAVERPLVLQPLFRPSVATGDDGVTKSLIDHAIDVLGKR
jgi:hypothetical protein